MMYTEYIDKITQILAGPQMEVSCKYCSREINCAEEEYYVIQHPGEKYYRLCNSCGSRKVLMMELAE